MIEVGGFKDLSIYVKNGICIKDKYGIFYTRSEDLYEQLNYISFLQSGDFLILDARGYWFLGFEPRRKGPGIYDGFSFKEFIFSSESIKDVLMVGDILEIE